MRHVCMYVCVCVGAIPVARTIGHLCGRTENDRNSSHYSRSKKEASLSPVERPSRLPVAARLSAPLPDRARKRDGMNWRSRLFHEGFPED